MDEPLSFYEKVFETARQIPYGRVTSYGAIARFLGSGKSARLVGYAMNLSHMAFPPVPAHRVVNRNGLLTGRMHFETPGTMQRCLEEEGLTVRQNQVLRFEEHFWDPSEHLKYSDFFKN